MVAAWIHTGPQPGKLGAPPQEKAATCTWPHLGVFDDPVELYKPVIEFLA